MDTINTRYFELIKLNMAILGVALSVVGLDFNVFTKDIVIGSGILTASTLMSYFYMLPGQQSRFVNESHFADENLDSFILLNVSSYLFIIYGIAIPTFSLNPVLPVILNEEIRAFLSPYLLSVVFVIVRYFDVKRMEDRKITNEYRASLLLICVLPLFLLISLHLL